MPASEPNLPRKPLLIGLTGGIGSGKSTVADLFAERGVQIVDTDAVAHALTGPGGAAMPAIREAFGDDFVTDDGALDRAAVRVRVFDDAGERRRLEAILHPMIRHSCDLMIQAATSPYALLVVPLMIESGNWRERVSRLLVVDCPDELRIERVMRRSHIERAQVEAIMAAQVSREQRLAAADDVVDNSAGLEALEPQVAPLHERYLAMAAERAA